MLHVQQVAVLTCQLVFSNDMIGEGGIESVSRVHFFRSGGSHNT